MGGINAPWVLWPQTQALVAAFGAELLRFVGGAVRDSLLERPVTDIDAATPLLPQKTLELLEKAGIKAVPTGLAHGTVTAVIDGKHFEITTLRKDIATDGRHAQVAFTDDWNEDAKRRDFTMNALYLSPAGELFDEVGGAEDARAGRVRFIGDADARIREDYLRILRFFRFFAHYGKGAPDEAGLSACYRLASGISTLSGERISHEMLRLLAAPQARPTLALMQECATHAFGISVLNIECLANLEATEIALLSIPSAIRRLCSLIEPSDVPALAERWRLSGEMKQALHVRLAHLPAQYETMSIAEQKALLRRVDREVFCDIALLASARRGAADISPCQNMLELAECWEPPIFPVTGKDLLRLGMDEGRQMGQVLQRLEKRWEESDYTLSREALLEKAFE